jgi:acyl transferase domain-containing protein/acyl carrier protein
MERFLIPPPTADTLKSWLVSRLAALRGIDAGAIDVRERFSRYGLDSLGAGRLIAELSEVLGRPLSPTLVWEAPTIEALAGHLTGEGGPEVASLEAPGEQDAREPIAIVGVACRFPGAPDPEAFWRLLRDGVDAISEVPRDRWDAAALFDPDTAAPGKVNTRWGGFLDHVDQFDPQFFGISPREAVQMDPQQRLVLELAWEALEDAGIPPPRLVESRTGVFVGALFTDYALLHDRAGREAITTHTSTGGAACIIANRVSYALGLQGPSLTLDTACSSSLVAVHLACQSLRSGESDTALAGGVNLMLVPETTMGFSRLGAMSPDGRSRAFGAGANGYVRSEGAGLVVLKRLSAALRDGDPIYAVVRGSAVNNDGASNGLTAPNPRAQQAVVRDACRSAGLAPGDVHYVEAHGTGTPLGDPIEASGLGAVYGAARAGDEPLLIGSAKTNVGHLEAAAGVVGLIKVALAMKHDLLPPSLHFDEPNPRIDFDGLHLEVVSRLRPWPVPEGAPRRAGVSSFGYGGTNGHVILESLPGSLRLPGPSAEVREPRRAVWVFSGQGSQWVGMGRALVLSEPAFRASLRRCDRALRPLLGWSVFDEIARGAPRAVPERIDVMWPTLFAFQVALAGLLRALGAAPAAVIGHSIGEVAAAHVAGALSIEDAARVIAGQARLVQRKVGTGNMLLAAIGWDEAEALAASSGGRVTCAIAASPMATVLAGEPSALGEIQVSLAARDVFVRAVNTSAPVHGPQMAFLADELPGLLAGLRPMRAEIPIISALIGESVRGEDLDVAYWARQLREPVRFAQGTGRLLAEGYGLFLEVSPHPIVKQSIEESIRHRGLGASAGVVAALVRGEGETRSLREALGALAAGGATAGEPAPDRVCVLPVSGQVEGARSEAARRLAELVERSEGASLDDLCYTASVRRPHHRARGVVVARGRAPLLAGLRALAEGREHPSVRTGKGPLGGAPKVVFVYPGQGSQWVGMGRELLVEEPAFREAITGCDAAIRREGGFSVIDEINADELGSQLGRIDVVQPMLFAMEVALTALWRSWGVEPDAVVGHSMGEIAAAHVAGALSIDDAASIICRRSRLLRRVAGRGTMALVELTLEDSELALVGHEDRLSVAVSNGPRSTVLSGDPVALEEVLGALEKRGVFCRRVKVDVASHSPQMDPLREELFAALAELRPRAARVAMQSTVTGGLVTGPELDASYWVRNLRSPVLFSGATRRLMADGHGLFIEMSPHPILLPAVEENLREAQQEGAAIASLRRSAEERRAMLEALGALHTQGHEVDWARLHPYGGSLVTLPTYPWQRERYWLEGDLTRKPVPAAPRDPLDELVYEVQWRKQKRATAPAAGIAAPAAGAWLIFCDRGGVSAALAAQLAARGQTAVRFVHGQGVVRVEPDLYQIDPANPDELTALLREVFGKDRPCRGVVHLSSLDATPWEHTTAETLESDHQNGFSSALYAAQAILRQTWRDKPRLWLVTQGAQAVGGERGASVAQAAIWGLGRTTALEHPELDCTLVDLDPARGAEQADELVGEIGAPDAETQIALRSGVRYVARLVPSRFDAAKPSDFRFEENATYLITGGLGGLGLSKALRMVEQGARHLALIGRRTPTEEAQAAIVAMEAKGAKVRVLSADVSRRADVERVILEITQGMPPLRGVLHAAGILDDATLLTLSSERFLRVAGPKILGAFHLHALTRELPLQFFVLYSSIVSVLGSPGQANYAAANACMDALAHARTADGFPATSIQWGPFAEVGMAAKQENRGDRMSARGIGGLSPEQGTKALLRFLLHPRAQVGFFHFDARHWLEFNPQMAALPFLSELMKDAPAAQPRQGLRPALDAAAPAERPRLLEAHVCEQLARVLRMEPHQIERLAPFKSLGVDSLLSLEARNRIEASLGLKLSATLLFTYSNVALLAEHLLQQLSPPPASDRVEAPAHDPTVDPDPEGDDDDLLAAFDASARLARKELLS